MIAVSERIAEKAQTLAAENRVVLMPTSNTEWWKPQDEAFVAGHTSAHRVIANNDGVWCDCRAWRPNRLCSHAVSAMAVWAEAAKVTDGGATEPWHGARGVSSLSPRAARAPTTGGAK